MRSKTLLTLLFVLAAARVSFADSLVGNFQFIYNPDDGSLNTLAASQGQVTFTLNSDGSIAASLVSYNSSIYGFGYDSQLSGLNEIAFDPTQPILTGGWSSTPDDWQSGFFCPSCGLMETWQIGDPGSSGLYSSVFDALGGGFARTNFVLFTAAGDQFGANAAAVPEPAIPAFLAAGLSLIGLGLTWRRRTCVSRT